MGDHYAEKTTVQSVHEVRQDVTKDLHSARLGVQLTDREEKVWSGKKRG